MNLDDQLRSAATDVRSELSSATPPPFEPPSPAGARVALLALVALVVGGGWWLVRPGDEADPVEFDVAVPAPDTTLDTSETPPLDATGVIVAGVSTADDVSTSAMDQPGLDQPSNEPDFDTNIQRLTNAPANTAFQPVYSGTQTYNADSSLLLLYQTGEGDVPKGHVVVDAATFEVIAEPDLEGRSDIENISWDPLDPDVLIFQRANELVYLNARTNEVDDTASFSDCTSIGNGSSPGSTINSSGTVGFLCALPDGTSQWHAFNRLDNRTLVGDIATIEAAPVPSISGDFFAVAGEQQVIVFDEALQIVRTVDIEASSFTMAQDRNGKDVLVATVFGGPTASGTIVVVDIESGSVDVIIGPDTGYPYPPSGTQLSTAATSAPFQVAIATNAPDADGVLVNEIMLLDLDGANSTLSRLAHHRNDGQPVGTWPSDSMVAISHDGTSVLFSSNWGTNAIDTYEILLTSS